MNRALWIIFIVLAVTFARKTRQGAALDAQADATLCSTPCDCPEFFACIDAPTAELPERKVCAPNCQNATNCLPGNQCFQKTCRRILSSSEDSCPENEVFDRSLNKCLCAGTDTSCGTTGCQCLDCNNLTLFTVFPDGSFADTGEKAARRCGADGTTCECLGNAQSCGLDPTKCVVCAANEVCNAQGQCECEMSDFSCPTNGGKNCVNCQAQSARCVPNPQINGTFQCGCDNGNQCISGTCSRDYNLCGCSAETAGSNVQCGVNQVCGFFAINGVTQRQDYVCGVTRGCNNPEEIDPECPATLPPEVVCNCLYGFPAAVGDTGFVCNNDLGINGTCQSVALLSVFTKQNQIEPEQAQTWQQVFKDLQLITNIMLRVGSILNQLFAASFDETLDLRIDPIPEAFQRFNYTCVPPVPKNVTPMDIDGSGVFTIDLADFGGNASDVNQLINYTECMLRYSAFPNVDRVISCLERNYFNDTNPLASASILQASVVAPRLKNNAVQKRTTTANENSGEIASTAQTLTNALSNLAGAFKTRLFILQDYIKFRSLSCTQPPYDEVKYCFNISYAVEQNSTQCGLASCSGTSLNCGQNASACAACNTSAAQTCASNNSCACVCGGTFPDACFACALGQVCVDEQCVENCANGEFNAQTGECECSDCWSGRFCNECNTDSCDSHGCVDLANGTTVESDDPNTVLSCTAKIYVSTTFGEFQCPNAAKGGVGWLNNTRDPRGCLRPNSTDCFRSTEQGVPAFCVRAPEKVLTFDPTRNYNHTQSACENGAHYNTVQSRCQCVDDWTGCFCSRCSAGSSTLLETASGEVVCVPNSYSFPDPSDLSDQATIRYQCSNSASGGIMHSRSVYSVRNGKFVAVPCFDNGQAQGGLEPDILPNTTVINNPDSTTTQPCFTATSDNVPDGCTPTPQSAITPCKHGRPATAADFASTSTAASKNASQATRAAREDGGGAACICDPGWTGNDCSRCRNAVSSYHCPAQLGTLKGTNVTLPTVDEQCEFITWLNYCRFPDGTELHTLNQCTGDGAQSYQQCFVNGKRLSPRCFTPNQVPNTRIGEPPLLLGTALDPQNECPV